MTSHNDTGTIKTGVAIKTAQEVVPIEWKIYDFSLVFETRDHSSCYDSPAFLVNGVSWFLSLYPRARPNPEFSRVYLNTKAIREYAVEYNFSFKRWDGSTEQLGGGILEGNKTCSDVLDIKRSAIQQRRPQSLDKDVITFICRLKFGIQPTESDKTKAVRLIKLDTLSKNFKDLIANKESCDTTLNVQDKEYKAHRAILIARSPVFAAMFLHETSEKQTGTVTISDCDPDSFEGFLEFLYTGKFEEPSSRSALYLYETSDKYEVQELKTFCVEYLMENLSVENVCDAAILADKYEEANLLSSAQDFFNKNLGDIFDTSEWDSLVKNNYRLSKILLKRMSSKVKVVD